jgi:hypothetical protein
MVGGHAQAQEMTGAETIASSFAYFDAPQLRSAIMSLRASLGESETD